MAQIFIIEEADAIKIERSPQQSGKQLTHVFYSYFVYTNINTIKRSKKSFNNKETLVAHIQIADNFMRVEHDGSG